MAVKYHCRKCGKRFMDWGAEKLGYKCPECEGEDLVRVGLTDDRAARKPALKRRPRRALPLAPVAEEEMLVPDIEEIEAEEVEIEAVEEPEEAGIFLGVDDEGGHVALDIEEVLPTEELVEAEETGIGIPDELVLDTPAPPLGDDMVDESIASEEWPQ